MEKTSYKSYNFKLPSDAAFPVYCSFQEKKELLASPHFHFDAEFIAVISGTVTVLCGTEKYSCSAGDIVYIMPSAVHTVKSDTPDAAIRGLVFHPLLVKEALEREAVSLHGDKKCTVFKQNGAFTDKLISIFTTATDLYNGDQESVPYRLRMVSCLLELISVLVESGAVLNERAERSRLQPAIDYIKKNYMNKIKIAQLSATVGLCDDRFIRVFKDEHSCTPTAYITEYRLKKSMQLLLSGEYSIAEVCELVGFSDLHYFSRVFKERVGLSPSQYRKTVRSKEA